jgi:hypothetical protein
MKTAKSIRYAWLAFMAALSLAPVMVLAASDTGTLTVGSAEALPFCFYGYDTTLGAYSPTELTGGETVYGILDVYMGSLNKMNCLGGATSDIQVNGFTSNPGKSWLTSVTCNGNEKTGSSANYGYSSGSAAWTWTNSAFGFILKVGTNVSCTIVHN